LKATLRVWTTTMWSTTSIFRSTTTWSTTMWSTTDTDAATARSGSSHHPQDLRGHNRDRAMERRAEGVNKSGSVRRVVHREAEWCGTILEGERSIPVGTGLITSSHLITSPQTSPLTYTICCGISSGSLRGISKLPSVGFLRVRLNLIPRLVFLPPRKNCADATVGYFIMCG
jgi:hypothetical protein